MWTSAPGRCSPAWFAARSRTPRPRRSQAGSPPLPELGPGQQWEVDSSLVDPEGLIARATGATQNGSRRTTGPGLAAIAAELPRRVVSNDEIARPLGIESEWISSRTGVQRRRRAEGESL